MSRALDVGQCSVIRQSVYLCTRVFIAQGSHAVISWLQTVCAICHKDGVISRSRCKMLQRDVGGWFLRLLAGSQITIL